MKLTMDQLITVLETDISSNNACIEISFEISNNQQYSDCWLGKMPNKKDSNQVIYWYGLYEDGSGSYDYTRLDDMIHDPVFDGKELQELIDQIEWISIDGCSFEEMLPFYLETTDERPIRSQHDRI